MPFYPSQRALGHNSKRTGHLIVGVAYDRPGRRLDRLVAMCKRGELGPKLRSHRRKSRHDAVYNGRWPARLDLRPDLGRAFRRPRCGLSASDSNAPAFSPFTASAAGNLVRRRAEARASVRLPASVRSRHARLGRLLPKLRPRRFAPAGPFFCVRRQRLSSP